MEKISNILPREYRQQMKEILGDNFERYIKSLDETSVRGFNINTKKISRDEFLKNNNLKVDLTKVSFEDNAFIFQGDEKVGFSPEHLAGLIYVQEPSSMMAVCASGIESEKRPLKILDLCAAPGGKTSQIANKVSDDSIIFSNEIIKSRAEILRANIERQGFKNVVVLNEEPKDLLCFEGFFDYVFVDSPCSGEGMFRKNPETIKEWNLANVEMCASRQREILDIAQKLVKSDGKLIYSTCTFNLKEDEEIVDWFLNNYDFELEDVDDKIKNVTLASKIKNDNPEKARKFFPFCYSGEGQFVAVFKSNNEYKNKLFAKKHYRCVVQIGQSENRLVKEFTSSSLTEDFSWKDLYRVGNSIYYAPSAFDGFMQTALEDLKFVSIGVKIGSIEKNRFEPNHSVFMSLSDRFKIKVELDDNELKSYLHGEELKKPELNVKCYAVITKNGYSIGGAKIIDGKIKNLYPRGLRYWWKKSIIA